MRAFEREYKRVVDPDQHTVIRVDGRAFSTLTRGMRKPFDKRFNRAMETAAEALCREASGALAVYVASDEISIIMRHYRDTNAQPWMGGSYAKTVSLSAALASAEFSTYFRLEAFFDEAVIGTFDSRAFSLPNLEAVNDYLLWRRRDTYRNAVAMICDVHLGKSATRGVKLEKRIEMLEEKGIKLDEFSARNVYGRLYRPSSVVDDVEYVDKRTGEIRVAEGVTRRVWVQTEDPGEMTVDAS